jgi:hypothetical protein
MSDNTGWEETAPSEDDFVLSGEGVSEDSLGGSALNQEGWYHFEVADVVPELETLSKSGKDKSPAVCFHLTVLKGVEGQAPQGSKHFHRVYVAGKGGAAVADGARNSAFRFGIGLGLLREIEINGEKSIVDAKTNLPAITIGTWKRAKGFQLVAKIAKETDEKYGDRFQIPFGRVYRPDDPQVKDVAKDDEAWTLAGNFTPTAPAPADVGQRQQSAPPAEEKKPDPPAVDPVDGLDDL